jgi:TPR repeat protein
MTLERAESTYAQGNKADAAALFRALAEGGNAQAQLRLAQLYEHGEGVLQNFVEAVRWFRSAAEQGLVPAMARLGEIYLTGMSAPYYRDAGGAVAFGGERSGIAAQALVSARARSCPGS